MLSARRWPFSFVPMADKRYIGPRAAAFQQWLKTLEQTLIDDRWTQKGSPEILPEGWPDKLPLM